VTESQDRPKAKSRKSKNPGRRARLVAALVAAPSRNAAIIILKAEHLPANHAMVPQLKAMPELVRVLGADFDWASALIPVSKSQLPKQAHIDHPLKPVIPAQSEDEARKLMPF